MESLPHQKVCVIEGCEARSRARGLCVVHYHRARHRGQLEPLPVVSQTLEERFWQDVRKGSLDGCWEWQGARTGGQKGRKGYGSFRHAKLEHSATHASWFIHYGEWPTDLGLWVLHKCDNPPCVNPDHLFLGTNRDNVRDMVRKGRNRAGRVNTKLTAGDVLAIRSRLATGERQASIAADYRVSQPAISAIARRATWEHVG